MRKLLLCAFAAFVACGSSFGQATATASNQDVEFQKNVAKIDMLYFFLPLAMTKPQIREILPIIEKYRQDIKKIEKIESEEMAKMKAEVDAALKAGLEEGKVPSNELRTKLASMFKKFDAARQLNDQVYADKLFEACKKIWNAGQQKVAAQSVDLKSIDPTLKPDQMKDDEKVKVFIEQFLMSPAAYDVLVKMSL